MSARFPRFDELAPRIDAAAKAAGGIWGEKARNDAGFTPFLARALEQFLKREFEVPLDELPLVNGGVVDIDESIDEGAKTFSYQVLDGAGIAEFYDDYAQSSMPMVTISNEEFVRPIAEIALGYEFSRTDVMAAAMAAKNGRRVNLSDRLSRRAVRGMMEKHENVGMFGDADRDLHGFANHPSVAEIAPLDDSGDDNWSTKSGDVILQDITNMFQAIRDNTLCTATPDALMLPESTLTALSRRDYVPAGATAVIGRSIIDRIREAYPQLSIGSLCRLQSNYSLGNLDESRAVMYWNNADAVQYILPMRPKFYEAQMVELMMKTPGHSRLGGIQWWQPFTAVYMDVDP